MAAGYKMPSESEFSKKKVPRPIIHMYINKDLKEEEKSIWYNKNR